MDNDMVGSWGSAKPEWVALGWIINVWGAAAVAVLFLQILGVHPAGVLLRFWSKVF